MTLAMSEHRGVPGEAGEVRAPRSEESPASLAMTEHRGVPGVAGDVHAVKCAHLLEHEETECRGVPGVAGDEARATNSLVNWSAAK